MADITSANATLILTVDELFPAGIQIQQFATDQSFTPEAIQIAETRMGVDGVMAAGQTPNIKTVTVMLEASSPSNTPLSTLHKAMDVNHKIYNCTLVARIPSIGVTISWSNGVLQSGMPAVASKKILDPTTWVFHFQDYDKAADI